MVASNDDLVFLDDSEDDSEDAANFAALARVGGG